MLPVVRARPPPAARSSSTADPGRLHAALATGFLGGIYAASAAILGGAFTVLAVRLLRNPARSARSASTSFPAYLALLFCAMAVDAVL